MSIARILHFELLGFLSALGAVVVYQMMTGRINLSGVLSGKDPNNPNQTSPERVQLLLATLAAAASYVAEVAKSTGGTMPDVSNQWLYLMGGSSSIYVLGKAWTTWTSKNK